MFTEKELSEWLDSDIDLKLVQEGLWKETTMNGSQLGRKLDVLKSIELKTELLDPKRLANI